MSDTPETEPDEVSGQPGVDQPKSESSADTAADVITLLGLLAWWSGQCLVVVFISIGSFFISTQNQPDLRLVLLVHFLVAAAGTGAVWLLRFVERTPLVAMAVTLFMLILAIMPMLNWTGRFWPMLLWFG